MRYMKRQTDLPQLICFGPDSGKIGRRMLLDMTIPGATSPEVIAEVARVRPDIRIIVTSAYSQEMLADKISALQICAFIRKPFRLADLVKMLQDAVPD